jgi:hypothetical protein
MVHIRTEFHLMANIKPFLARLEELNNRTQMDVLFCVEVLAESGFVDFPSRKVLEEKLSERKLKREIDEKRTA